MRKKVCILLAFITAFSMVGCGETSKKKEPDIQVTEGAYVNVGQVLGAVAAPSRYYSLEGTNLYFAMTKDGEPVNPETYSRHLK